MPLLLLISVILLVNLWIFLPFFGLGLYGDDWLTIFRYSYYLEEPKHLGSYSTDYFNNFKYLFNAYGTQDTVMAMLYKTFGVESNIYFILSYLLRVGAGFSVYLPAFYLTKSKLAAYFAVFFFLFSSTGLEASGWVFNMPSYLAIIFFSLFLYFYLHFHEEKKMNYLFVSFLCFFLAFLSNPIRGHGLLPFVILLEMFWLLYEKNWKTTKSILIRISGFLLIFLFIYLLGFNETLSGNALVSLKGGLTTTSHLLSQGRFDFLFYPLVTLGSMLIPETFVANGWEITSFSQYLFKIFLPIFSLYMIIVIILTHGVKNLSPKFLSFASVAAILWGISTAVIYKSNLTTFSSAQYVSFLLIGGYLLIITLTLFAFLKDNQLIKIGLLVTLGWTMISYFFPWWTNPHAIFLTTHRYLIVSSIGLSLLLSTIIGLGKNIKTTLILIIIGSIFILLHTISTRNYLNRIYTNHNRETVKKIWSQIPHIPEVGQSTEPLVFYFESDGINAAILGDSVGFGFPFHMALLYKITEENKTPISMIEWREVESAVLDGTSLGRYTGNRFLNPISIERVYAFRLQGKDNLINITDPARKKLMNLIKP